MAAETELAEVGCVVSGLRVALGIINCFEDLKPSRTLPISLCGDKGTTLTMDPDMLAARINMRWITHKLSPTDKVFITSLSSKTIPTQFKFADWIVQRGSKRSCSALRLAIGLTNNHTPVIPFVTGCEDISRVPRVYRLSDDEGFVNGLLSAACNFYEVHATWQLPP